MNSFLSYPDEPGFKARETSHAAAEEIAPQAPLLRARALSAIRATDGLTADEVAKHLRLSILSIRPRITELSKAGAIRDTGRRRKNASGKRAIVWAAASSNIKELASNA